MHRNLRSSLLTAFALAGSTWLAGCSSAPMGPGSNEIMNPTFLSAAEPAAGTFGAGPVASGPLDGFADIDGAAGGTLQVGRFTVTVPAGAFKGKARVSIHVPDAAVVRCQLQISPASSNTFAVPVVLRTDCSGTSARDATSLIEIWLDEQAGVWRQVPGSMPDVPNFDVVAPLSHFSQYGAVESKAGW